MTRRGRTLCALALALSCAAADPASTSLRAHLTDLVVATADGDITAAAALIDLGAVDRWVHHPASTTFAPPARWTTMEAPYGLHGRQIYGAFTALRLQRRGDPLGVDRHAYLGALADMRSVQTDHGPFWVLYAELATDLLQSPAERRALSVRTTAALAHMSRPDRALSPLRRACRLALVGRSFGAMAGALRDEDPVPAAVAAHDAAQAFAAAERLFDERQDAAAVALMRRHRRHWGTVAQRLRATIDPREWERHRTRTLATFGADPDAAP